MDLGCRLCALDNVRFAVSSKLEGLHQYHKHSTNLGEELKRNRAIFENKFQCAAGDISIIKELDIWDVLWIQDDEFLERFAGKHLGKRNKVVLEFKNREKLDQLKANIVLLSDQEELDIEVYDYCEDTDLDIWIQLLGARKSISRYFPISRRIGRLLPEERSKKLSSLKEA